MREPETSLLSGDNPAPEILGLTELSRLMTHLRQLPTLTLAAAKAIAAAAEAFARERGWTVAIAVVDAAGGLILFQILDDTQPGSQEVAVHKARTAARFKRPTKALEETVAGGRPGSAPGTQDFWVASDTGRGARTLEWDPADGSWTVVVMHADGRPGIDVGADLGARLPALPWIALGVLIAGAVFLTGGGLLSAGAVRRRGTDQPSPA